MSSDSPFSFSSFMSFVGNNFGLIVMVGLFFAGGFFFGSVWTENKMIKDGTTGSNPSVAGLQDPSNPTAPTGPTGPTAEQLSALPEVTADDFIRGSRDADVIIVEYSDFECPFCQRFHPTMEQVIKEYGSNVAWVFRHYPLTFHPNAQRAAEASECVAKFGGNEAFWTFADTIFDEQERLGGQLNSAAIDTAIGATGVDAQAVNDCIESGEMAANVQADFSGGSKAGVTGTPGSVVITKDGAQELIPGALPFENVQTIIEKYL